MERPWYTLPDEQLLEMLKTADKPFAYLIIEELATRDDARAEEEDLKLVRLMEKRR